MRRLAAAVATMGPISFRDLTPVPTFDKSHGVRIGMPDPMLTVAFHPTVAAPLLRPILHMVV